jgi:hypothetical protein
MARVEARLSLYCDSPGVSCASSRSGGAGNSVSNRRPGIHQLVTLAGKNQPSIIANERFALAKMTGSLLMQQLERYVGRNVRLKHQAFQDIARRSRPSRALFENCFLVASVSRGMRKLVCYGATQRITVDAADVVLI